MIHILIINRDWPLECKLWHTVHLSLCRFKEVSVKVKRWKEVLLETSRAWVWI